MWFQFYICGYLHTGSHACKYQTVKQYATSCNHPLLLARRISKSVNRIQSLITSNTAGIDPLTCYLQVSILYALWLYLLFNILYVYISIFLFLFIFLHDLKEFKSFLSAAIQFNYNRQKITTVIHIADIPAQSKASFFHRKISNSLNYY